MAVGTVKWFNDAKGFGIIVLSDGSEIFVHYTAISGEGHRTLAEGQMVNFDIYEGKKGPLAKNVAISN